MFLAAGRSVDEDFIKEQSEVFELDRAFAAFEGKDLVGTVGTRSLQLTLPGGKQLPIAAIGQGGVLPSHTRRGIMRELMNRSMSEALKRSEPLAAWTTSEWPLYQRYGGGPATFTASYRVRHAARDILRDGTTNEQIKVVTSQELLGLLPDLHVKSTRNPGGVPRNRAYWKRLIGLLDGGQSPDVLETRRDYPAAIYCVSTDRAQAITGACAYRVHQEWSSGIFQSQAEVMFLVASTIAAEETLLRMLLGLDLVDTVLLPHRPLPDRLRWMLKDGRRLETLSVTDHLWLRIFDPVVVLENRWFPPLPMPIVLGITDQSGFTSASTVEINSDGMCTTVATTNSQADAEMDIATLSAILLGGNSVGDFASSNRISTKSPSTLSALATAFAPVEVPFTDTSF
jgi:predicted acetyltransferase